MKDSAVVERRRISRLRSIQAEEHAKTTILVPESLSSRALQPGCCAAWRSSSAQPRQNPSYSNLQSSTRGLSELRRQETRFRLVFLIFGAFVAGKNKMWQERGHSLG